MIWTLPVAMLGTAVVLVLSGISDLGLGTLMTAVLLIAATWLARPALIDARVPTDAPTGAGSLYRITRARVSEMNIRSLEGTQAGRVDGPGAGAAAGVVATTVFTLAHHLFISPIWWAFPFMAVAGALCGAVLVWCYGRLVVARTGRSWAVFVAMFVLMFGLLALASSIVYEPTITMAEVVESTGGNPIPIGESMGLMVVFTFGWAGFLSVFYRGGWRGFAAGLVATTILMVILGVNVSTMGLVEIPTTGWVLVLEFFGYLVVLGASFGVSYRFIERMGRKSRPLETMS